MITQDLKTFTSLASAMGLSQLIAEAEALKGGLNMADENLDNILVYYAIQHRLPMGTAINCSYSLQDDYIFTENSIHENPRLDARSPLPVPGPNQGYISFLGKCYTDLLTVPIFTKAGTYWSGSPEGSFVTRYGPFPLVDLSVYDIPTLRNLYPDPVADGELIMCSTPTTDDFSGMWPISVTATDKIEQLRGLAMSDFLFSGLILVSSRFDPFQLPGVSLRRGFPGIDSDRSSWRSVMDNIVQEAFVPGVHMSGGNAESRKGENFTITQDYDIHLVSGTFEAFSVSAASLPVVSCGRIQSAHTRHNWCESWEVGAPGCLAGGLPISTNNNSRDLSDYEESLIELYELWGVDANLYVKAIPRNQLASDGYSYISKNSAMTEWTNRFGNALRGAVDDNRDSHVISENFGGEVPLVIGKQGASLIMHPEFWDSVLVQSEMDPDLRAKFGPVDSVALVKLTRDKDKPSSRYEYLDH